MHRKYFVPIAALFFIAAILLAGTWDYEEEVREQTVYCQMVGDGAWPDYNGNYAEVCHGSLAQK